MNIKQLKRWLERHDVPTGTIDGVPTASLRSLLRAINKSEIKLMVEDGKVLKKTSVVIVVLLHPVNENVVLRLIELSRETTDGKTVYCTKHDGIGKKIRPDETPVEAAQRCLKEKLGFTRVPKLTLKARDIVTSFDNNPVPSTIVVKERFFVAGQITKRLYKPCGYRRVGERHKSTFVWAPRDFNLEPSISVLRVKKAA